MKVPGRIYLNKEELREMGIKYDQINITYGNAGVTAPGNKDSNPKDALGIKKVRWASYIPLRVLYGIGLAMYEGARKYARHNYRAVGVRASVYIDAAICGHLVPWMEGEDIDPDSGLSHIDKAIASLVVLRDSMYAGNFVDDRPPKAEGFKDQLAEQQEILDAMMEKYPDAKEPVTELNKEEWLCKYQEGK